MMDQTDCARIQTNRQGMELALVQARLALAEGEVPVGAVVVDQAGCVLAQARNATGALGDPMAHGELLALQKAQVGRGKARLTGCTLYVTLEPCAMCAAALVHARLAGVVYGAADDLAGAVISRAEYLDAPFCNHRVWHMGGVRAEACAALLRDFFERKR